MSRGTLLPNMAGDRERRLLDARERPAPPPPAEVWIHEAHVYGEGVFPAGVLWFEDESHARLWMEGERLRRIEVRRAEWRPYFEEDGDQQLFEDMTKASPVGVDEHGRLTFDVGGETVVLRREVVQRPARESRVRQRLSEPRIGIATVAKEIGVTQPALVLWLRGRRDAINQDVLAVLDAYDTLTPSFLAERAPPPAPGVYSAGQLIPSPDFVDWTHVVDPESLENSAC